MRRQPTLVLLSGVVFIAIMHDAGKLWATPPQGFVATTLAVGRFGEMEEGHKSNILLPRQEPKGRSDLYVQSNVWQPGGSTGWHTHPGESLIIVTEGTVTGYEGGDPDCKPHLYTPGMGFVDPGGGHVHILRNEAQIVAKTIAVQLIPAAAARRIDVVDPGNCHF
jgi:Cupin domain